MFAASAEGAPESVRVYCHSAANRRTHGTTGTGAQLHAEGQARTCLLLNLGDTAVTVSWAAWDGEPTAELRRAQRWAASAEVWVLEAASLDAAHMRINGVEAATLDDDGTIPPLPAAMVPNGPQISLGATAAAFVRW